MRTGDIMPTILIVEDSPTQAEQLRFILLKHEYSVEVAQNGILALEAMRRRKPDVVISDIVMPEMDGYGLCLGIREDPDLRDASIVMLTSLSETDEVLRALECGADYFITKPYEEDFLTAHIRMILAHRNGSVVEPDGNEIAHNGKIYSIATERRRILDLLLSTYESTIRKNTALRRAHDEVRSVNDRLERAVLERTRALQSEVFERKRAEEALADLKLAEENLVRRHKELSVLHQITTVISDARELQDLCTGVLSAITQMDIFVGLFRGTISLVEDGRFTDSYQVVSEKGSSLVDLAPFEECLLGVSPTTDEIVISKESGRGGGQPTSAAHGHIIVPLKTQERVLGVICLCMALDCVPEANDARQDLLRSLGNQVALGIENARLYEQTRHNALHDPLTGLPNRRHMEIFYEKAFAHAVRGAPLSLIMLDIDHFKKYNDTYGHSAGDVVIKNVGRTAMEQLRTTDLIARYGGEEFLVILQGTGLTESLKVAERVRAKTEEDTGVTISLGVAAHNHGIESMAKLIECADSALYLAKKNGRNRVEIFQRDKKNP
jgi:diguanylate cyclase (GGDEF)-like protein